MRIEARGKRYMPKMKKAMGLWIAPAKFFKQQCMDLSREKAHRTEIGGIVEDRGE